MDYVAGPTLQQKLDATGPLDLADVLRIGRQAAAGLAAAHAMGLIHRDVKPGNILLEDGVEHVKITDFGLARAADDASITQSGFIAGTPMYMAPEQALGEAIDRRADLFSLGSVLYTMCSGRPPFRAPTTIAVLKRVVEDTPHSIRDIIPEVPEWLCELIARLHAKNPADRTISAQGVADLLARHLAALQGPGEIAPLPDGASSAGVKPPPWEDLPGPLPAVRRPHSHRRRRAIAAAVLVMLFGGLGFTEATGVTHFRGTVIRLFSPEGTLVVEVDDPGMSVKIDGPDIVITGAGVKEIRLQPGRYNVEASKDGKLVKQELVNVTRNGRQVLRVSRESAPADAVVAGPVKAATAWERSVAGLSAHQQMKAVTDRLEELNPGFNGKLDYRVEEGVVRELAVPTDCVGDISPVHALAGLKRLRVGMWNVGPGRGVLADLSPLRGLSLEELNCAATDVSDLSPVQGMPLTRLEVMACPVSDLSPLAGMPISFLDLAYIRGRATNLEPLQGMPLVDLNLTDLPVSDLTPLKGIRSLRRPGPGWHALLRPDAAQRFAAQGTVDQRYPGLRPLSPAGNGAPIDPPGP